MKFMKCIGLGLTPSAGLAFAAFLAAQEAFDLRSEIEELAHTQGFMVQGLERIGDEPAIGAGGELREKLKSLLQDYDHVLLQDNGGKIEKLLISGRKRPGLARDGSIKTDRRGPHHEVKAILRGPNGLPHRTPLVLDTGASTVVLPSSMLETLGFRAHDLKEVWAQTANGKIKTKLGMLKSVQIGAVIAQDVAAMFVEDERLGENKLLGMSFLDRFWLTIDDANSRIILMSK